MSVLIRDIEIPKNCQDCPLNYDQMACKVTGTRWWSDTMVLMGFDSDKERLYDCPLIELPTPHGRLIDADVLKKSAHLDGQLKTCIDTWIDSQVPVIEAEGSEE